MMCDKGLVSFSVNMEFRSDGYVSCIGLHGNCKSPRKLGVQWRTLKSNRAADDPKPCQLADDGKHWSESEFSWRSRRYLRVDPDADGCTLRRC